MYKVFLVINSIAGILLKFSFDLLIHQWLSVAALILSLVPELLLITPYSSCVLRRDTKSVPPLSSSAVYSSLRGSIRL